MPVYNPSGRYWVKLYYMGKLRKIEIDDTMPCTKYDEFLLPKCESLEELWPALITKALIKLYFPKFLHYPNSPLNNYNNEEVGGDTEWFYTNKKTLDRAFGDAFKIYGGKNLNNHLDDINENAERNERNSTYTAEIHYKIYSPKK